MTDNNNSEISLRKTNYEERVFLKKFQKELKKKGYTFRKIREIKIKALLGFREKREELEVQKSKTLVDNALTEYFRYKTFG